MIDVQLFANLTSSVYPRRTQFEVDPRPGLTVREVAGQEGIAAADIQIILVNGRRADLDTVLTNGDRLGLFPAVGGG